MANVSTDFPAAFCAIRASRSLRGGLSDRGGRPSLAFSSLGDLLGTEGAVGDGLFGDFEIGEGLFGGVNGLSKTNARLGTGGAFNCDISISGFAGARVREPDVAFDAELPGRGGRTRDASGASSESSDDELELSSVSLISRATDLGFGRAKIKFTGISVCTNAESDDHTPIAGFAL